MSEIDYAKRQEEVRQWLQEKGKPEPKTWSYHQAEDGRYFYWATEKRKRYGELGCCEYCNKSYLQNIGKFCSEYCSSKNQKQSNLLCCEECKLLFDRRKSKTTLSGIYFCSKKCRNIAMSKSKDNEVYYDVFFKNNNFVNNKYKRSSLIFVKTKKGIKYKVLKSKCSDCFISAEKILQIHHIDSNPLNNDKKNLEVLCPNHHAIRHLSSSFKKYFHALTDRNILRDISLIKSVKLQEIYLKTVIESSLDEKYNKKLTFHTCSFCKKFFNRKKSKIRSKLIFCSRKCQSEASKKGGILVKSHYNNEIYYRDAAFRHLPNKCADCDVCFEPILDVHHKDGNRENNDIENLEILCPNHHASRHMRQDENGEWVYSTKSLTPRDKLEEVKRGLGI